MSAQLQQSLMPHVWRSLFAVALLLVPELWLTCDGSSRHLAAAELMKAHPAEVGLDSNRLAAIDTIVARGIIEKKMPGCVVCVGRNGKIALLKAYGNRQLLPEALPMTTDTVFDLASITKPVATATCIMKLVERGQVRVTDRVTEFLPEFGARDKASITIFDLLTHQSGLLPDNALVDYEQGADDAIQRICALGLRAPVRSKFIYSDVNFIVLGEIIRRVTGKSVAEFSRQEIFEPLGMRDTQFVPEEPLRARAAPTEQRNGRWIRGEVHDPRAYLMAGVAGHAGLFATAEDLAIYAQMMLEKGGRPPSRILAVQSFEAMTRSYVVPNATDSPLPNLLESQNAAAGSVMRGLGWDKRKVDGGNRGKGWSDSAFGHGGFTGTVLWIDPQCELFYIFLSNRVHPDGKGVVNPLAGEVATVIADAVLKPDASK